MEASLLARFVVLARVARLGLHWLALLLARLSSVRAVVADKDLLHDLDGDALAEALVITLSALAHLLSVLICFSAADVCGAVDRSLTGS